MTSPQSDAPDAVTQAIRSEHWTEVERYLTDLPFVEDLLVTLGPAGLASLYEAPYESGYQGPPFALVARALRRAAPILDRRPDALPEQLLGQLDGCDQPVLEPLLRTADIVTERGRSRSATETAHARRARGTGHEGPIGSVAVAPDGARAVTASDDGTLRVWDLHALCTTTVLTGHIGEVTAVAILPDGQRALSASTDRTLKLWDLSRGVERATLVGHDLEVRSLAAAPDGSRAASGSADGVIIVWDVDARHETTRLSHGTACVNGLAWTPDGERLVSAGHDGVVRVWDPVRGREADALEGHTRAVLAVAAAGGHVVSGSSDGTIRVWDLAAATSTRVIGTPAESLPLVELSPVQPAGRVGHWRAVNGVVTTGDGHRIVSASADGTIRSWDGASGAPRGLVAPREGVVWCVAITPDGTGVLSGGHDGELSYWDLDLVEQSGIDGG